MCVLPRARIAEDTYVGRARQEVTLAPPRDLAAHGPRQPGDVRRRQVLTHSSFECPHQPRDAVIAAILELWSNLVYG